MDSKIRQLAPAPTLDTPEELKVVDQKESAGAATIARIDFVCTETCQQLEGLASEVGAFKQLVLEDAQHVRRAVELLVESGKSATDFANEAKGRMTDLRSKRAKLVKGE